MKKNRGRSKDGVWESPGTEGYVALIQTACPNVEVSGRFGQRPRPEFSEFGARFEESNIFYL